MTAPSPWPPAGATVPARPDTTPPPGTELGMHYAHCFGCGDRVANGLRLRTTVGDGLLVHTRFTVTAGHQGAPGLAHGGLLTAAFDEALGCAAGLLRVPVVTGRLETDFRRPVPVDTELHITASVDGVLRRKVYLSATGRLAGPDGPVAVAARALFVQVELAHFTEQGRAADLAAIAAEPGLIRSDVNP